MTRKTLLVCVALAAGCASVPRGSTDTVREVATFSIVAVDTASGEMGVAVASRFLAVGAVVPWARAGVGAVATQAWANTTFGPKGLELMAGGKTAAEALRAVLAADPRAVRRQVGIVDAKGRAAAHTGSGCFDWAGHRTGPGYTCQGNILTGRAVVDAIATTFESARGDLADRLCAALLAGDRSGGDSRGRQSAAVFVVRPRGGYSGFNDVLVDLRVDDHADPVKELQRLNRLHRRARGIAGARRPVDSPPPKKPEAKKEDF